MTAIGGIWRFDHRPDAAEANARMLAAQKIYGPHAVAQWSDGDVSFGWRQMRILPEDIFDHQPLTGGGGRYVLTADVRLDNRDELTGTLRIDPELARRLSDAMILLAAIERWGDDVFKHILGDYAFALWDCQQRRLMLARDPTGQRPLYYHRSKSFLAFASMPKGLHALPEIPRAIDRQTSADFLVSIYRSAKQSFFDGISSLEAGCMAVITERGLDIRRHWLPRRRTLSLRGHQEYAEALREQLDRAVQCRLRGGGDIAAHLSGGLDSSAVASTAARLLAPTDRRIFAFTAVPRQGFDGKIMEGEVFADEGPYAAATAALYPNIEHVLIRNGDRSPIDDLDRTYFLFDQPSAILANIGWMYDINDAARDRKLTVMLNGMMGNITFSFDGAPLLPELLASGKWLRLGREIRAMRARGSITWRWAIARTLGPWCPGVLWSLLNLARGRNWYHLPSTSSLRPELFRELDVAGRARSRNVDLARRPWKDSFDMRLLFLTLPDNGFFNKGYLGGWQIDMRDPTSDKRLIEFGLSVPTDQYLRNGVRKALPRLALADRLPRLVLEEYRAGMQSADWHEHLTAVRGRLGEELERLENCPQAADMIDLPKLRRLVENWPTDGWETEAVRMGYNRALMRGISMGHFIRRVTGSNS